MERDERWLHLVAESNIFDPTVMVAWNSHQLDVHTSIPGWDTTDEEELQLELDSGAGIVTLSFKPSLQTRFQATFEPSVLKSDSADSMRTLLGDSLFSYCQEVSEIMPELTIGVGKHIGGFPKFEPGELSPQIQLWMNLHEAAKELPSV